MNTQPIVYLALAALAVWVLRRVQIRLRLSRAKHPSLRGHSKLTRKVARLIRFYEYTGERFFCSDDAPADIAALRRAAFERLARGFESRSPRSIAMSRALESSVSDLLFTNTYRVPFQYRGKVSEALQLGTFVDASAGTRVRDLDGNWSYDLTGSYGVNVFGYDFYKECIERGMERVRDLGPVLGPYHPLIADNVARLKTISQLDEVSFHMSGTEAVMQAVRLARFHTGRPRLVMFCGAYHGWWDGVQPGLGSERIVNDVYTLREMSAATLKVLRTRKDIACVLVNPLQALHPNANAPGDSTLYNSARGAHFDRDAYAAWLGELRSVCSERGIVLIFDEVFVGFRIAYGGAQEYFGVRADMVTYGKTLGGGLPVGVVCGKRQFMKRFREDRPTRICFARGTFNSHPYVLAAMNEFLRRIEAPGIRASYASLDDLWNERVRVLNERLRAAELPVRVVNLASIWTVSYTRPSRYNWMFQFYLRAQGLALGWIGTGRLILSHNFDAADYEEVMRRFVAAAQAMQSDAWWWAGERQSNRAIAKRIALESLRGAAR